MMSSTSITSGGYSGSGRRRQHEQQQQQQQEPSDPSFSASSSNAVHNHNNNAADHVGGGAASSLVGGGGLSAGQLKLVICFLCFVMIIMGERTVGQWDRHLLEREEHAEEHHATIHHHDQQHPPHDNHVAEEEELEEQKQQPQQARRDEAQEEEEDMTHMKYYELKDLLQYADYQEKNSYSAYSRATVVWNDTSTTTSSSWFRKRKQCKETCCVETVAISLDQDDHKLINGEDGRDLADVMVEDWNPKNTRPRPKHLNYFGSRWLPNEMIPCLLPGTIIFVQNDHISLRQFWNTVRPQIQVPYVLVVSGTDGETPGLPSSRFLSDPLLLKMFGTNPKYPRRGSKQQLAAAKSKYQSIPLGLSRQHGQEKQLLPYMKLTNYTNPFWDFQDRFNLTKHPLEFEKDVFVHFGLRKAERQKLWNVLCPKSLSSTKNAKPKAKGASIAGVASCNKNTNNLPIHDIYTGMSQYRFGISPTGYGYDCYRTYEMLLLGIIPIVEKRSPPSASAAPDESEDLFHGLPVIKMSNMEQVTSQQDFITVIENYMATDKEFQMNAATNFEEGWKRLFLSYNRRQVLEAAGRTKDILVDDETTGGKQYYQAYHYTVVPGFEKVNAFCPNKDCSRDIDESWMENPNPTLLSREDQKWLEDWEEDATTTTTTEAQTE